MPIDIVTKNNVEYYLAAACHAREPDASPDGELFVCRDLQGVHIGMEKPVVVRVGMLRLHATRNSRAE